MAALAEAFVSVRADTTKVKSDVEKGVSRVDGKRLGGSIGANLGNGMRVGLSGPLKAIGGLMVGAFAVVKSAQVFTGFINDARESAKVSRITANAIKVTGGAAKITADQVGALATAISNKTGIDDEQIQTASNMLLTFKNIRNEAGKGNQIFNRATQAVADLSVQFGGTDAASKQLGKALNDPIKGIAALNKAGVTFTEQQKKQIKTLVDSGDVLSAQKIILKEVEGQVGGAAAAAADPMQRLQVVVGNLGESLGGLLLPVVNKVANFVSDTFVPGIYALGAAFKDPDVTSDGFVGFMERVGVVARFAFDYFKTNVLPRLREFAGFVRDEVVPRLRDFAVYIRDNVVPIVAQLAREHLAKLQELFNKVRNAIQENRPQLQQLWNGLLTVAKVVIEKVIPFLARLTSNTIPLLGTVIGTAIRWVSRLVDAFNAIKTPVADAMRFVISRVLDMAGVVIHSLARAFGGLPKIGDPLKKASKDFDKFAAGVNKSLNSIDDEAIRVALSYTAKGINLTAPSSVGRKAAGGGIHGPGTGTSDTAGLYALSNNEHVVTAREVMGAGGHAVVEATRRMWAKGMAAGGRVGLNIQTALPSHAYVDAVSSAVAKRAGLDIARSTPALGSAGPPGAVRSFRGVTLNERTIRMLLSAEQMLGSAFRILQGSYSTRVAASGGTHAGGGAMDTNGPRGWSAAVTALRRAGFAAWHRTPAQGPWGHHIHSIAIGDPTASPAAKRQVQSFLRGGDGLGGGTRFGSRVQSFDRGGWLQPGLSLAHNGTGKPEPVGFGGVTFNNCTFAGTSKREFTDLVVGAIDEAKRKRRL